jgi:dTDP-4-amino-4,6-dideoxygalactose transaminase
MKVPFQDLLPANRLVEKAFFAGARELFRKSAFSGGAYVESFERAYAACLGSPRVLGVNSGTSAVHLALAALGVGPGDEVVVPAFTFVGSAWGILYCGAKPVFADVDAATACLTAESVEAVLTRRTKAVIAVHLFGRPAPLASIASVLKGRGIALIEDAAQAHGARIGGRQVGSIGDAGCFSFYPSKNLGAAGEAGAVAVRSAALADRIARLRNHGQKRRYHHELVGYNERMDGLQALFLERKLAFLDRMNAARAAAAARYLAGLRNPRVTPLEGGPDSVWHLFVCRAQARDRFLKHLDANGIGYGIHYPIPLPELPPFRAALGKKGGAGRFPNAYALARSVVSLPLYYGMKAGQLSQVIRVVNEFD